MVYTKIAIVVCIVSGLFLNSNLLSSAAPTQKKEKESSSSEKFAWKGSNGKNEPDTENRKSKNNFGAMLLATDEEFLRQWEKLAASASPTLI